MKFNCGETSEARRDKWAAIERWHPFFAIWPREVAPGDCRAFEWIERKGIVVRCTIGAYNFIWQYRARE